MTDPNIQTTINALLACHRTCVRQITTSLDAGGKHAARTHITQLMDCADICRLTGDLLDRQSPWTATLCELAAEITARTAENCERLGEDACAKSCTAASNASAALTARFAR
ncbi:four-helix bundle copper-binding protein [Nocardia sp. NPDC127526]|uniref:four-helix bundle copper-binding protein n=1 Tax=Nocardia sp. NPDC127526 TaxID=3345393 RepID=UPI003632DC63